MVRECAMSRAVPRGTKPWREQVTADALLASGSAPVDNAPGLIKRVLARVVAS